MKKSRKKPDRAAAALARKIEAIRLSDPPHYRRIMRKLAQLERRSAG